jgi:hypothetical protein
MEYESKTQWGDVQATAECCEVSLLHVTATHIMGKTLILTVNISE